MTTTTQRAKERVAVVGLGYVGLPLLLLAAKAGYSIVGIEIDDSKVTKLKRGKSYIDDVTDDDIRQSRAVFASDIATVAAADIVVICVPTPVTRQKMPDLRPLKTAIRSIAPHIKRGALIVIESTINPGVCDEVLIPQLEAESGLTVGSDIDFVHCPERVNPGDPKWHVGNINRVIGGSTPRALKRGAAFYQSFITAQIKPMGSLKEAEAVKVVENAFRDINIAFANELAMAFHKLGIDLENVIDGAATKPFAFMAHHPGCGVGGHCIPVDPYYLIEYSRRSGFDHRFLSLARTINEHMPHFTIEMLEEALKRQKLTVSGAKVGLLGLSYKANVGDDRESPAHKIRKLLVDAGVRLEVFDPFLANKSTQPDLEALLGQVDHLVLATAHDQFAKLSVASLQKYGIKTVIDGRNMWRGRKTALKKANIVYLGIGQSA